MSESPNPSDRDAFLEWMVGRQFKLKKYGEGDIHFEGLEAVRQQGNVATESGNPLTENVKAEQVSLRVETLGTTDEEVDGRFSSATVTTVDDRDGDGEVYELPFDTIRIEFLQGRIEEL